MRPTHLLLMSMLLGLAMAASAELQNVEVGGSIRIRGDWFDGEDNNVWDQAFVEQRTRLSVKADFSEDVTAFIELDEYDIWGEDFRSQNYITGVDNRAAITGGNAEVEVYQAYIEAREMFGTGLRLRVGRQEIALGSQWLVGVNDTSSIFQGLSFDGVMLSYLVEDNFAIHGLWSTLAEGLDDPFENDVDLFGVYASCTAVENMAFDAYWLAVRDDGPIASTVVINGKDAYIHTFGMRGAGTIAGFDFEAEAAYQTGQIDWAGRRDLTLDAIGVNLQAGYTIDIEMQPRPFVGFAYFGGIDDSDLSFNRLFSNWEYSEFLENTDLSNCYVYRAGIDLKPLESVELSAVGACFVADKDQTDSREAAWEVGVYGAYHYTEDLIFRAGYAHMWADNGIFNRDRITLNGLAPFNDARNEHLNYVFLETELKF